jgi:hypothetical protein
MKKKTTPRFHGFQTPPIFRWFNTPSHRRPTLTWIRYGNGKGLVPSRMAGAIQQHNEFCDKRDAFIAQYLPPISIILLVAIIILAIVFLAVR